MKITREKLRTLIQEAVWSVSKDQDYPAVYLDSSLSRAPEWGVDRTRVYHFRYANENLSRDPIYTLDGTMTHGDLSHCIKHFIEFEPNKLRNALSNIRLHLSSNAGIIEFYQIVNNTQTVRISPPRLSNSDVLNTLDRINDDIMNNTGSVSSLEEELLRTHIFPLLDEYNSLIDSYISEAIDVSDEKYDVNDILQILNSRGPRIIKFLATYSSYGQRKYNYYYYNLHDTGQVTEYIGLGIRTFTRLVKTSYPHVPLMPSISQIKERNIKADRWGDPSENYSNLVEAIKLFKERNSGRNQRR